MLRSISFLKYSHYHKEPEWLKQIFKRYINSKLRIFSESFRFIEEFPKQ